LRKPTGTRGSRSCPSFGGTGARVHVAERGRSSHLQSCRTLPACSGVGRRSRRPCARDVQPLNPGGCSCARSPADDQPRGRSRRSGGFVGGDPAFRADRHRLASDLVATAPRTSGPCEWSNTEVPGGVPGPSALRARARFAIVSGARRPIALADCARNTGSDNSRSDAPNRERLRWLHFARSRHSGRGQGRPLAPPPASLPLLALPFRRSGPSGFASTPPV